MSGAHTPGPWQFDGSVSVEDAAGNLVALVYSAPMASGTISGNGNLIAAAPELLAALQVFVDFPADVFDEGPDAAFTMTVRLDDMRKARAAIAKATGGAS